MTSTEQKPSSGDDIKDWEDISNSNQISTNNNNQPTSKQEIQNEQAELSEIETGGKGQPDFDELIFFGHSFLNYRIARCFATKDQLANATFGLLMTNVFIYSGDAIDISYMENMSDTESVKNIRAKINSYKDDDIQYKITFLENVSFYVKTVGFQETAESILPILSELPKEKEV